MKYLVLFFCLIFFIPSSLWAHEGNFYSSLTPNDKYYNQQWYLQKIKAEQAWNKNIYKEDIIIAIIDSGVEIDHPDLAANIWKNTREIADNAIDDDHNGYIDDINGWDFINDVNDPNPKFAFDFLTNEISHGTVVAGIIGAVTDNQKGIAGLARNVKLMPLLVLDSRGVGDMQAVIRAINYAIDNKADIINLSFAGNSYSAELEAVLRRAYRSGILIVAAAGNDNNSTEINLDKQPMYPVCNDGYYYENMVLGVAATDALDQKASFSAYGHNCVDISAPGVSVFSTSLFAPRSQNGKKVLNKHYDGYYSGTSMAAPLVSATAAMVLAVNPSLKRQALFDILQASADYIEKLNPQYQNQMGAGRLNVERAVRMAQEFLYQSKIKIINAPASSAKQKLVITDNKGLHIDSLSALGDFHGPINIAAGNIDNDSYDELVIGAGFGGGPQVQIFTINKKLINQFFAYNQNFHGGVNVAVGDVNGDGVDDIITGAGPGGGPHVRIFNKNGGLISQFFAYDKKFHGGIKVAVGDINGGLRKYQSIITSPASQAKSHIRVFNYLGELESQFFAYDKKYKGETNIAIGDMDKDGLAEIITGAGAGGTAHVRIFKPDGRLINAYLAYDNDYLGGVHVATINYLK